MSDKAVCQACEDAAAIVERWESSTLATSTLAELVRESCRHPQQGWVSVEERLPEPGVQVIARRANGTWDRAECNPIYFDGLPAWYMPEGPTESGGKGITHWSTAPGEQEGR